MTGDAQRLMQLTDRLQGIDMSKHESRILCLSTAMISEDTNREIDAGTCPLNVRDWYGAGWMFFSSDWESDADGVEGFFERHPELRPLMQFADERGFSYIRFTNFDDPFPPEAGFPIFDW